MGTRNISPVKDMCEIPIRLDLKDTILLGGRMHKDRNYTIYMIEKVEEEDGRFRVQEVKMSPSQILEVDYLGSFHEAMDAIRQKVSIIHDWRKA